MKHILSLLASGVLLCAAAPAAGLTPDEIVYLKKNGVADETIQLMLRLEHAREKDAAGSISLTDTPNAKIYSTGPPTDTPLSQQQQLNVERAWNMLENMQLEIER